MLVVVFDLCLGRFSGNSVSQVAESSNLSWGCFDVSHGDAELPLIQLPQDKLVALLTIQAFGNLNGRYLVLLSVPRQGFINLANPRRMRMRISRLSLSAGAWSSSSTTAKCAPSHRKIFLISSV
ncbi:hypothetical protein Q2941_43465 [Bradyrhizobium sp. UFLA05-153]